MQLKPPKTKYVSIPFQVELYLAWRNIVTKKLRSFLTIMGVIIGIGSIFFLLSLGLGLENLVTEEIIGNQSVKSIDVTSPNSRIVKLDKDTASRIDGLSHVETLGTSYSFAGSLKLNKSEIDTIVYGIDTDYQKLATLEVEHGRLLENEDYNAVFINKAALEAVGITKPDEVINQEIELRIPIKLETTSETKILEQKMKLVGIIDSGAGSEIFIPGRVFEQAGVSQYSQIKMLADSTDTVGELRQKVESMGFETSSPVDTVDQINQIFKYFNVILVGFGAIGMIVAVLGMFNTLTISLLERTKEIGLMIALGGRHKDMRTLFILEAVLLSVLGSVIGIICAIIGGKIINLIMNHLASNNGVREGFNLFATPWWLVGGLIIFMVIVGLLVVLLPARRAQKINPIDALRRE